MIDGARTTRICRPPSSENREPPKEFAMHRPTSIVFRGTILFLLLGSVSSAWACYAVVAGRGATTDGSVLVGHNEENGGRRVLLFHKIPRQKHAPGEQVVLDGGGRLEQAAETWAMLWSENPGLAYSDGYLNEWGVAVVSDGCPSREDSVTALIQRGEIRQGGIGYMLRRLVAQRAKTAREGVLLMGRLVEQFGYLDSGRTYVIADPREAWLVAVVRGRRWVAQRVPDDRVAVLPNVYVIGEVDLSDTNSFLAGPDLVSYAVSRGWFDPAGGAKFNFRLVYGRPDRLGPDQRQFRGQELASGRAMTFPPAEPLPFAVAGQKKLAVADMVAILRDDRGIVPLFQAATQESAVFQLRQAVPAEIGCVYWRTTGRPDVSPLTPWYPAMTAVPPCSAPPTDANLLLTLEHHFQPPAGTFDPDPRLAWWKAKAVEKFVDADYAQRLPAIQAARAAIERRGLDEQATVEAAARAAWATDHEAARTILTRHCAVVAERACQQAEHTIATR
jgi:dipeptidase